MRHLLFAFIISIAFSCSYQTTQRTGNDPFDMSGNADVMNINTPGASNLTEYLRQFSGVIIRGTGAEADIKIRSGANSFMLNSEPLFLINGNVFNGNYSALYSSISINDIGKIVVYKDASDLAFWGSRGANGVIDIKLRTE